MTRTRQLVLGVRCFAFAFFWLMLWFTRQTVMGVGQSPWQSNGTWNWSKSLVNALHVNFAFQFVHSMSDTGNCRMGWCRVFETSWIVAETIDDDEDLNWSNWCNKNWNRSLDYHIQQNRIGEMGDCWCHGTQTNVGKSNILHNASADTCHEQGNEHANWTDFTWWLRCW